MEAVFDIPVEILQKAQSKAQQSGLDLNLVITQALQKGLEPDENLLEHQKKVDRLLAAMDKIAWNEPVGKINRDDFYDRSLLR